MVNQLIVFVIAALLLRGLFWLVGARSPTSRAVLPRLPWSMWVRTWMMGRRTRMALVLIALALASLGGSLVAGILLAVIVARWLVRGIRRYVIGSPWP